VVIGGVTPNKDSTKSYYTTIRDEVDWNDYVVDMSFYSKSFYPLLSLTFDCSRKAETTRGKFKIPDTPRKH
jgi:hypothetical protein